MHELYEEVNEDQFYEQESDDWSDTDETTEQFDIMDFIILRESSTFVFNWKIFTTVTCMLSSYFYIYAACFGFGENSLHNHA